MHRFYLPPNDWNPDALLLTGSEAHHARTVLRLLPGDKAVLFDGRGREITAEIASVAAREVQLRKLHAATTTPPLRCKITLAQAIPKGKNMDLIVQKAVEIGAAEIVPIFSDRTIVRLDAEEAAQKQSKWQTVAIEAAKQCGQNWLPEVQMPRTVAQFFAHAGSVGASALPERGRVGDATASAGAVGTPHSAPAPELRLIGSLQSDAMHLKNVLSEFATEHGDRPMHVLIVIGPEGDFTPAEINLARSHGCWPITLGPIILRVETAAIYCLSVLSYELL
ncbi:16S rRNA (uracil(1498)-N(3))-methyltransferase [soil metagenome]